MFSTADDPSRRFLSITATDIDGQGFKVIASASGLSQLDGLSASDVTRLMYRPTAKAAANLARSVLEAGLLPLAYPLTPSPQVVRSPEYRELVRATADGLRALEVVGPVYDSAVHHRVSTVTVQVVMISFQSTVRRPVLRAIGPAGFAAAERSETVGLQGTHD